MVGLPARGKTYIAKRLCCYLNWTGTTTRVFNVGNYRRATFGAHQPHSFFDAQNAEAREQRRQAAMAALEDMKAWFGEEGVEGVAGDGGFGCCAVEVQVAIYDATNTTKERRALIKDFCTANNIKILFIESICEDEELILENIRQVKLSSPDYTSMDEPKAIQDFRNRIHHYTQVYEPIDETPGQPESSFPFVKLVNVGAQVRINSITEYLQSRIIFFLMNLHIKPRSIYLVRHGESQHNVEGKIGGDADLSEQGQKFARLLPELLDTHLQGSDLTVWTSTLKRTIQTAKYLSFPKLHLKALDELDSGVCEGLTYEEIAEQYPQDFLARDHDKFRYRYSGGESYSDLVTRLEPVIMELERQENVLVIAHQAVLRTILAYFLNRSHEEMPYIKIPLHVLIKLTPKAYGCEMEELPLDIPAVDTFRPKPTIP